MDRLKLHALWNSLASNVASPFVAFNVAFAGASDLLVGYVVAVGTLASAVSQLIGGLVADKSGRRARMAVFFSLVTGLLWIAGAIDPSPTFLAFSFTAIWLTVGLYLAGWTSLIGEASEKTQRGAFLSRFARLQTVGALGALVLTVIVRLFYPTDSVLYLLSGAFFLVSAAVLQGQKDQRVERLKLSESGTANLKRFYAVTGIYGLSWGFAWPLFIITTVKVVKMTPLEYSVSQVIAALSTILFQPLIGRLVDRQRKKAVFWGRMGLVVYPIAYMLFSAPWQIYVVNAFSGITNALLNVAFIAYLYDISPAGQRGKYNAQFNLITGVSVVTGSLTAAYTLSVISTPATLWLSLAYLYAIAAVGRGLAALLHLKLPSGMSSVEQVVATARRTN